MALFPKAIEPVVLLRIDPQPRLPVTTLPMILTWSAATGPVEFLEAADGHDPVVDLIGEVRVLDREADDLQRAKR